MAAVAQQWTNEDIIKLLCTLNLKIEDIRVTTKGDNRKGLHYASELISREIGDGCNSSRVERKIKQLWANYGHPEGGKDPYNLCLYGAFPKTLPGIGLTLLSTVASRVVEMQSRAETPEASSSSAVTQRAPSRRFRRRAAGPRQEDPVCCRCGFTHNILWVHCDGCATWQHAYCYYDTEDESKLPDCHFCDDCKPMDETLLNQKLSQLHIQSGLRQSNNTFELRQRSTDQQDSNATQHLGPFGLPIDEEITWGPGHEEIHDYHDIITSLLRNVANLLEPELDISKTCVSSSNNPDTLFLVQEASGLDDAFWSWPEILDPAKYRPKRRQLLRAILAAALNTWIFNVPDVQQASYESILLFHYQEEVFNKHDMRLLKNLHRCALIRMMENRSPLHDFIADEAEKLCERCLDAILPMTMYGQRSPSLRANEWVASQPNGKAAQGRLLQALTLAMKLKRWLPLTDKCFEIYAPTPGCIPPEGHVIAPDGSSTTLGKIVKLCLMPGVVEYLPDLFFPSEAGPHALCGERNLVRASEEQRSRGRVICPAIVVTGNQDSSNIS